jgi:hypothetical protein
MSLLDLILPTPAKAQEQLTTIIAKQMLNIMSKSKFSAAASVQQTATIYASGSSKITNVSIIQAANINTTAFLSDQTVLDLKSDLKDSLKNVISNESSNMPFGREQNVNTRISNVVDKSIEENFSHENMVALNSATNQVAAITAVQSGQISDAQIQQRADIITKFTNTVALDIASQLIGTTTTDTSQSTKTNNFLAEIIATAGSFVSNLLSAPLMIFMVLIVIVVIGAIIYKLRGGSFSDLAKDVGSVTPAGRMAGKVAGKKSAGSSADPTVGALEKMIADLPPVGAT